jgi:DNA-binding CsgD family transcriptional regulator
VDSVEGAVMNLTPREHEVMGLLIEGYPIKTIAADLRISDKTVKTLLNHAYVKLGAKNRSHAAAIYARSKSKFQQSDADAKGDAVPSEHGFTITGNVKDGWRCR